MRRAGNIWRDVTNVSFNASNIYMVHANKQMSKSDWKLDVVFG